MSQVGHQGHDPAVAVGHVGHQPRMVMSHFSRSLTCGDAAMGHVGHVFSWFLRRGCLGLIGPGVDFDLGNAEQAARAAFAGADVDAGLAQ